MPSRPTIMGTRHVIAAGHHLAAQAGFEILEQGGNAVDAGVAAGLALNVLQADKVNFGGVAPIMIYGARKREVHCIDGLGVWPQAMTPDFFQKHHGGKIPTGVLCSVVPAAPDAWITALTRFGTMTWSEVAGAAIRFAREGFPTYPQLTKSLTEKCGKPKSWPSTRKVYLVQGRAPEPGELLVQEDLGKTLQYLADVERSQRRKGRGAALHAARDAFYKGDIAAAIVKYHRKTGGLMSMEDFAGFKVKLPPPVKTQYQGMTIYACGPWSQGPVLPMTLNILKGYDLRALPHNSPEYIHIVAEALKLAFADRHQHFGDPDFVDVPLKGLMSDAYAARRRDLIRADRACPEMPPPGDPATGAVLPLRWMPEPRFGDTDEAADTTYVACVDRHGNAFSATPSDTISATPIIPGTGIVCSGRGTQAWADPTHPSSVAAGKRPRLTPSPALVLKKGRLFTPLGSPGGDMQPQAMLQVLLNIQVFGMDVQSAIEAPRFASFSFPDTFEPHAYYPGRLQLESRIAQETGDELARLGHDVRWWDESTGKAGSVCAIVADHKNGVLHGGADPRRPTYVLGW